MTKVWYVYMLKLSNGAYYTGITNDVHNRIKLHNEGKGSKYVRSFLPFTLVYLEEVGGRSEATKREIKIKKWGRIQKISQLASPKNLVWKKEWRKYNG